MHSEYLGGSELDQVEQNRMHGFKSHTHMQKLAMSLWPMIPDRLGERLQGQTCATQLPVLGYTASGPTKTIVHCFHRMQQKCWHAGTSPNKDFQSTQDTHRALIQTYIPRTLKQQDLSSRGREEPALNRGPDAPPFQSWHPGGTDLIIILARCG